MRAPQDIKFQPFNARLYHEIHQLIEECRRETAQHSTNFEESWDFLKNVINQLPLQLPALKLYIMQDEAFKAKIGRYNSGMKLVFFLGFVREDNTLYLPSKRLSELQLNWKVCEQAKPLA